MAPNDVQQVASAEHSVEPVAEIEVRIFDSDTCDTVIKTIPLYANKTVKIGRDLDNNDFQIEGYTVSRNHLEFYSVLFDDGSEHFPLVYVRDRQSNVGIGVNRQHIKNAKTITPAILLQHGDQVRLPPYVKFELTQPFTPQSRLSTIQSEEVELFSDRYTVFDRTIGHGGSARVHLAIDRETGDQLACKVYDLCGLGMSRKDDMTRKLMQEAFLRCQLEHPNIASFRGAYKSRSTLYIFEDLATGGDLFSLMARDRKFSQSDVRFMIHQVVRALAYMHEKGVAHRDLKLENILCAVCPKPGHRLVITDFGHSAAVGLTRMDEVVGTEGWQAPELLNPPHRHGPPVDIWSLGVLATQLLAGMSQLESIELLQHFAQHPGDMKEPSDELDRIFDEIEEIRYECIDDAKSFIRRCFQANPLDRMTAAEALEHDWLCKPNDDHKLFLRREAEINAGWRRRGVLGDAVTELPDLRQLMADDSPCFTRKECRPGLHSVRQTADVKEELGNKDDNKKRSRMQDILMLPQNRELMQRCRMMSAVPSREEQEKLLKALEESGKLFVPQYAKDQFGGEDVDGYGYGDEHGDYCPSKRVKV